MPFGVCHAKLMYASPYLILGSTNWSVSSEANRELSAVLEVEDRETQDYVEGMLDDVKIGAVQIDMSVIAGMRQNERRAG